MEQKTQAETRAETGRRVCAGYVKHLQQMAFDRAQDNAAIGAVSRADIRALTDYILLLEEVINALKSKDQERMAKAIAAVV